MLDQEYSLIREGLLKNVGAAKLDGKNNLQNLNVLLEGFFREFLNLLYGWNLINANREKPNFPGADLLDRERKIAVQVSGTADHKKVQHSLDEFKEPGKWEFYFLPIREKDYSPNKSFSFGDNVAELHILTMDVLLGEVQHADFGVKRALADLIDLDKVELWEHFDGLLRDTRKNHPSFRLMEPDEIDKRLYPNVPGVMWDPIDQAPCALWEKVRETWKAKENHSVVIEGKGGIGKTVSLLSLTDKEGRWCPAPAVYIPMHRLIDTEGKLVDLSDYLEKLSKTHGANLIKLSERKWEGGPQVILLLDGFNEVPVEKRRQVLHQVNKWRTARPGAQLIAVSRPMDGLDLGKELTGDPLFFSLEPLSWETAEDYLKKWGLSMPDRWEELRYPLFLTLYVKTSGLEGQTVAGYPLAPKPPRNGAALIWNYLQRELLKYQDAEPKLAEDWVLRCSMACEYILPYVAYEMEKKSRFTIQKEELNSLVQEAVRSLGTALPKHLKDIFDHYDDEYDEKPDFSAVKWGQTVRREVGILIPVQKGTYQFMHQNFRDVLAALHLVNQGEMMKNNALPELWKQGHSSRVLDRAAQLMERETAQALWEANRQLDPTQSAATYTQLELQKRVHRGEGFPLDFSGMDLREISLYHYLTDEKKDLGLLRRKEDTSKTKLSPKTFRAQGHAGWVNCVAMIPNGLCISGASDTTLRIWDFSTWECLRVLEGHTGSVNCVAVTPKSLCVSGSGDGTLRVWNLSTGECRRVLTGHTGAVRGVAVIYDNLYVSGAEDRTLRVWDLSTGECRRVLDGHTDWVTCVAVISDGLCVSGSNDHTLRVWDPHTGKCLRVLEGHTAPVRCVAVTNDGLCVSGSDDHTLRVWDPHTGKCLRVLEEHTAPVRCVAVTNDGLCVSGSKDSTLRVWDTNTGDCYQTLEGHTDWVLCVAVISDSLCVSGSGDGILRVWNPNTGEKLQMLVGHIHTVNCVSVTSDSFYIGGYDDHTLRIWNPRTRKCLQVLMGHTSWIRCVSVTPGGLWLSGSDDNTLRVWDLNTRECLRVLEGHTGGVRCVATTYDGLWVSGSLDHTLRIWNLSTGECRRVLVGHTDWVYCVAVVSKELCISGSKDNTLRVWNLNTGKCIQVLGGHTGAVRCMAVIPSGLCVSGSYDNTLRVWNLNTGECIRVLGGHTGGVRCLAVTPNGLCISGSFDHTLRVWDPNNGKCLQVLNGHTDWVRCVAVINEKLCVSGSADHTLRLWDLNTGECVRVLKGHIDRVNCVAVTSDGLIVSGSDDHTLRTWDPNTGECLNLLEPSDLDLTPLDFSLADLGRETSDYFALKGVKGLPPPKKGDLP